MKKTVIKSCDRCKSMKHQNLREKLGKAFPESELDIKCQSFCGPGGATAFAIIDEEYIYGNSIDQLIAQIKKSLETEK